MNLRHVAWDAARAAAHRVGSALLTPAERVELAPAALGRTLALDVQAHTAIPAHDTSAMDGWVVADDPPWRLDEPLRAGDPPPGPLAAGHARPVATGAPTPPGAVGVLRSEHGAVADGLLHRGSDARADEPRAREHIRPAGEESAAGEILIPAGAVLTPPRLALAAVAGHDLLPVRERPVVDLAFLGDEVVTRGVPDPGSVRDAYGVQLPGLLGSLGADVVAVERVPDRLDRTVDALRAGHGRLLICTGGTARGASDHLRAALEAVGAELDVDGIAMRPGHPTMLARLDAERAALCLPGNPMAAMVAFIVLGVPLLDGMLGRTAAAPHEVELGVDLAGARVTRFVAYRRESGGAVPTQRQGSGMLRGLADAEGLLIVPTGGARRGERIAALSLPW